MQLRKHHCEQFSQAYSLCVFENTYLKAAVATSVGSTKKRFSLYDKCHRRYCCLLFVFMYTVVPNKTFARKFYAVFEAVC